MTSGPQTAPRDLRGLENVRGIFACLSKYIHAKTIYASNNPNVANFAAAFHGAVEGYFHFDKELILSVDQYRIRWREETVYENREKTESIAFLLYKDGVGEITLQSSVTSAELDRFVELLRIELYTPSAHVDVVSRLWQADFAGISYRVYDECSDGAPGEGHGTGCESREQPLQALDHPHTAGDEADRSAAAPAHPGIADSLGAYLEDLVGRVLPDAASGDKETRVQEMLACLFTSSSEDLSSWRDEHARMSGGDKLVRLLTAMLDFAEMRSAPPVVRDIGDIIDRLVRFAAEETHIPTLTALLAMGRAECRNRPFAIEFQSLPSRIEHEITNTAFLLSLGKTKARSARDAQEALGYFRLVGGPSVPGVCELLATLKDPALHKSACDTLIEIAGKEIPRIVNDLNLDNPYEARDAAYLLRRCATDGVHPVAAKLLASSDPSVREEMIEYLAGVGNDEAAALLCSLVDDGDPGTRTRTFAAVEELRHPAIVEKVLAACFTDDIASKEADELERMFRAAGKLGGERTLGLVKQMLGKGSWFRFGKSRGRQNKLLAVTALRHIPGGEALALLRVLAQDPDSLVRTKSVYALKHADPRADDAVPAGIEDGPR